MNPYIHTVQYYETDKMGVTHHSNYIRFMEEARVSFLRGIGWDYGRLEEQGVISPVVSVNCRYIKPSRFADEIAVYISVADISRARLVIDYDMKLGGETICTAQSVHCFVTESGKPLNIQKSYPEFFSALLTLKEAAADTAAHGAGGD